MISLRELASRIRGLFGRAKLDQDLDEELQSHLEMLIEDNMSRGMSFDEARRAARRSFGGVIQTKEAYRDQRGLPIVRPSYKTYAMVYACSAKIQRSPL